MIPRGPSAADRVVLPASCGEAEYRERGSRFIAVVRGVSTPQEARDFRAALRRHFHDASHHVLAARFFPTEDLHDDDGEPAGTAGRPVLNAISASGLVNVGLVVTRYFGGTKLGTGPLARAYTRAAADALDRTGRSTHVVGTRLRLRFAYEDTGAVMRVLAAGRARRLGESYSQLSELEIGVAASEVRNLRDSLRNSTGGRIEIVESDESLLFPETDGPLDLR